MAIRRRCRLSWLMVTALVILLAGCSSGLSSTPGGNADAGVGPSESRAVGPAPANHGVLPDEESDTSKIVTFIVPTIT